MNKILYIKSGSTPAPQLELTEEQARRLHVRVAEVHRFMASLKLRLEGRSPAYPRLREVVAKADDALQHLSVHLHYEAIGWGERPRPVKPPG